MKSRFPVVAAVGVVLIWGALLGANFGFLNLFKDFKVEMPPITMLWNQTLRLSDGVGLPAAVLLAALLLAYRQLAGWYGALALCVAANLAGLALLMPLIALRNNLSGGVGGTLSPHAPNLWADPLLWLMLAALVLNQILSVGLLFKRPDFAR